MEELLEIEAIKQLKYRYFRFLDSKQFTPLVQLFAEDATTAYDNGRHSCKGRDELFSFLDESMGTGKMNASHQAHHPEITIVDETHATGIWHFEDTVNHMEYNIQITGSGIYWDEYIKIDGQWCFQHTGYERLWVSYEPIAVDNGFSIRSMFDEEEKQISRERPKRPGELLLFPND